MEDDAESRRNLMEVDGTKKSTMFHQLPWDAYIAKDAIYNHNGVCSAQ